jgi:lysophospholipase
MAELVATARNPIPSGAVTGQLAARDGVLLRYARWNTTAPDRLGTVCLFGGRGEFIEKYFETITDLRRRGFAVAMMDWRGQGGSSRLLSNKSKGHVESFADHDDDLRRFMAEVVLPDCTPPFFALAHSMGGNIILRSAQTKVCWYDRIVLSAPMIKLAGSSSFNSIRCSVADAAALIGFGDLFIPGGKGESWEEKPFEDNKLTSDKLRYDRAREVLQVAPHLGIGSATIGWVSAACNSISLINSMSFVEGIKVPILIVAAGNDQIVSTEAAEIFANRVKNCTRIVISGAKHELLQERDALREQFWAAFDAYVPGAGEGVRGSEQPDLGLRR